MKELAFILLVSAFPASPCRAAGGFEPRTVLALYLPGDNAAEPTQASDTPIHLHAEIALNFMGLDVEYIDASRPLPDISLREDVRGILAWFSEPNSFGNPRVVCRWMKNALDSGVRVVLLGELGIYSSGSPKFALSPECRGVLQAIGLTAGGTRYAGPLSVEISTLNAHFVGLERRPDPSERPELPVIRVLPGGQPLLSLSFSDGEVRDTAPVAATPKGGVALDPFLLYVNESADPRQLRWILDPFAFFERAFAMTGLPKPDANTINGRRVYMSRIDGDGIFDRSEIVRHMANGRIFLDRVVNKYPTSPFTISLVAGYYDLTLYRDAESLSLSQDLLTARNVEPASHGYAHPLDWKKGIVALTIPQYKMDDHKEILGSIDIIEKRITRGTRKVSLFQWTGDCLPTAQQVQVAETGGLLNLNGGGGRFDRKFPSYAFLYPVGRNLGSVRQIYAPAFNEYHYTDNWSKRFYGYRDIIETFERTGSPRRVKAVDIYVHFYAASKFAALDAMHKVYGWARKQPLIPVMGTRYARAARASFQMRISTLDKNRYRLEGGADVRTVRFDEEARWPDLQRSSGVIGYRREAGSLYVSLDGSPTREIVMAAKPGKGLLLEEANFEVEEWTLGGEGVQFRLNGWWTPEFTLAGLRAGAAYQVRSADFSQSFTADPQGRLHVRLPDPRTGESRGEVRVERGG